jgi:hypothetical protein
MVSPRLVERGAEYSGPTNQSSGSASFLSMLTHDFPEWKKYWVSNGSLDIPWQDVLTDQNREEIIEIGVMAPRVRGVTNRLAPSYERRRHILLSGSRPEFQVPRLRFVWFDGRLTLSARMTHGSSG